jgi:hypothetical protein
MIEKFADLFLAMEAVVQSRIALDLRMWDFDGDLAPVSHVRPAINGSHPATGDKRVNPVVIELIAAMESHRIRSGQGHTALNAGLWNAGTTP